MSALTTALALFGLCCVFYVANARKVFVAAPNTLRLGSEETVSIFTSDSQNDDAFSVYLQDFPARKKKFSEKNAVVRKGLPIVTTVKATQEDLPDIDISDPKKNTYVYFVVTGVGFSKEFKLLVSPQSGHIFIQTDKPIYSPQQIVNVRVVPLNEHLLPKNDEIHVQIRTPQDVVAQEKIFENPWDNKNTLFPTYNYKFPPYPLLGDWSVVVLYGHKFQVNSTVHFKVDEYVLPTFTVKLDVPNVVLPEDPDIQVRATATYVYGRRIKGTAIFKFGIKHKLGNIIEIGVTKTKRLKDGEAEALFGIQEITKHPKINAFPLESRLFVEVDIIDSATGNREKVVNEECIFTHSPYHISFKYSQRDFKPGLVSAILAEVTYVNGRPAIGVSTSVSVVDSSGRLVEVTNPTDISDDNGHVLYHIGTPAGSSAYTIKIKTNDVRYKDSQQYTGTHILSEYKTSKGCYIAISRLEGMKVLKVGEDFSATVYTQPPENIKDVFFMVLSRGRIVHTGKLTRDQLVQRLLLFKVTADMVPHIRIVTYALCNDELVADSVRVEVENICLPQTEVTIETKFKDTSPGSEGNFLLRGTPETSVGILAVDSAVYALRDKDRLTKAKFFKTLENDDLGCGPGGGVNTELVLANAGVTVFGNFQYSNKERTVLGCAERQRRKREAIDEAASEYGIDAKKCCHLGTFRDKYDRSCEERANIVRNFTNEDDDGNCTLAFQKCCNLVLSKMNTTTADDRGRAVVLAFEDFEFVENLDEEEKQASVRKDFRETWLFQDSQIGPGGTTEVATNLPHSITTWIIQAVSVSPRHGMCVSDPETLVSFKKLFLHLNLPYSVVQNEQVEIQATVFNYNSEKVPVTVYMYGVDDLCTGVPTGQKSERKKIIVDAHSTATVGFPVVPLEAKEYTLRVVALSVIGHDVIEKVLRVVPPGVLFEEDIPVVLDPGNQRNRKERNVVTDTFSDSIDTSQMLQLTAVKLRPSKEFIPGTESCVISAIGDEFGPTVETVLHNPETLVRLPIGCGEQTMMFMGPTVYTMNYLKTKGKITPEYEGKVYGYIREGYNRELTFRKTDGSYAAFTGRASSTWLTAFVMKIFCQSSKFVFIDQNVICSGMNWLIRQQNADGSFTEKNPLIHRDMVGGLNGAIPMTAFVLISLQQCSCEIESLKVAKFRAQVYLEGLIPNINDPYVLSLVTYALVLSDSNLKNVANDKLRTLSVFNEGLNQRHWSKGGKSHAIETTAYALLAQVALGDMPYSLPIVNWLNTQRLAGGVFPSTQDTVIALEALSEYSMRSQTPKIDLHCNITSSNDKKFSKTLQFQNDNADVLQQFELEKVGGTVFFRTSGTGVGQLSVKLKYNVPRPMEALCKFNVTANVADAKPNVKPAVVRGNVGKDFFDDIPVPVVRALGIEDDHAKFRNDDDDIKFDYALPNVDEIGGIDPRIKVQDYDNDIDDNGRKEMNDEDLGRNRAGDEEEDDDDRNRADDEDERERGIEQKANSKAMLKITICARYLSNKTTDMSIIEAGIFSGFVPVADDLKKIVTDNLAQRYEMAGRSIIFYLNHVPSEKPVCLEFRITREFIVGLVQPTVIKVYDYYNTEESCTLFYSPDSNSAMLRKICDDSDSVCQCAEGGCPPEQPFPALSKKIPLARDQLLLEACEKHHYVWLGVVESVRKNDGFIRINFKITKVLKAGAEQKEQIQGTMKTLLLQDSCTTFQLIDNQEYLIMGNDGERFEDRNTKEVHHRYVIDKTTIIHKWVLIRESQNKPLQKLLNWLENQLSERGCKN